MTPLLRLIFVALAVAAGQASAYTPVLNLINPRGAQLGTEVTVTLHGERLFAPEELLFYKPGITVKSLEKVGEEHKAVRAHLVIAPDAELGEHPIRLRCKGGVTWMRTLWVGQFPTVMEKEPNNEFEAPQEVPFNTTVQGVADLEDADYYRVTCRKGQRLSVEVEGMRLGRLLFDPYVAILDANRFELTSADDIPLLRRDCAASVLVPEDGTYTILVRESSYQGRPECQYRLHIGAFPRPTAIYPPAARRGEQQAFRFIGDASGEITETVTLPVEGDTFEAFARAGNLRSPSGIPIRLSDLPGHEEVEPNEGLKDATPSEAPAAPVAFHGVLDKAGDRDWFRFRAKKGQTLRIQVHARSLRSPLDSVIAVRNDKPGANLASNDDAGTGQPDSRVAFEPPADGVYYLNIRDQLNRFGPDFIYRIEITPRTPALAASLPYAERNKSQKHKMISVPRGNRTMRVFNISRQNLGCEVDFTAPQLPGGVAVDVDTAPRNVTSFPVVFEANGDASIGGGLYRFEVRDPKNGITGPVREVIHHVEVNNAGTFHSTTGERHAVAVIEEAPFQLKLEVPPVPLVQNGTMILRINAERREGFDAKIKVTLPWKPPGVGAPASVEIPAGKNSVTMQINANAEAPVADWRIAVAGEATGGRGPVLVSSRLQPLKVAEPYVAMSIAMAATEIGKDTQLVCAIEHLKPFEGQATLRLLGLPHGVSASEASFAADQPEVIVPVTVTKESRVGKHSSVFGQIVITENGHPIRHSVGAGGTLRIDPPPPAPKKEVAEPAPAAKPKEAEKPKDAPKPKKPLSRLEQLRQAKQNK